MYDTRWIHYYILYILELRNTLFRISFETRKFFNLFHTLYFAYELQIYFNFKIVLGIELFLCTRICLFSPTRNIYIKEKVFHFNYNTMLIWSIFSNPQPPRYVRNTKVVKIIQKKLMILSYVEKNITILKLCNAVCFGKQKENKTLWMERKFENNKCWERRFQYQVEILIYVHPNPSYIT